MIINKIAVATLVSAGLILGATGAPIASGSNPTVTVTAAAYNSQIVEYRSSLATFDSFSQEQKGQSATFQTALQVYQTAYATLMQNYRATLKANAPGISASQYAASVVGYNTAITSYVVISATYQAALSVYRARLDAYDASYKTALQNYETVLRLRQIARKSVSSSFNQGIIDSNAKFVSSTSMAKTESATNLAIKARHAAVMAALNARKVALAALGTKPVAPARISLKKSAANTSYDAPRPSRPVYRNANFNTGVTKSIHGVVPTPAAGAALKKYRAQVTALGTPLIALSNAAANLNAQAVVVANAAAVAQSADNAALQNYQSVVASNSPVASDLQYAALLAAYNVAVVSSNAAIATFNAQLTTYQAALASYNASYQSAIQSYATIESNRQGLYSEIKVAFNLAIQRANDSFSAAMTAATTDAQRSGAIGIRNAAIVAAVAVRKAALDSLGNRVTKPSKEIVKTGNGVNYAQIFQPVRPMKPLHVRKTSAIHRHAKVHLSKKHQFTD